MDQNLSAINKIIPPDLPEVIMRKRLFDLLDQDQHCPITWISATAGSGKTTLAASYLIDRHRPCIWYQFDERDGDISTFFYYLGLAVRNTLPHPGKPLPVLTQAHLENPVGFTANYFENLCSQLPKPFTLVFDNYQHVPSVSGFHTIFKAGLERIFPDIQVFVLSRSDPPPEFISLSANSNMRVIGPDALYLTPEETAALLERETGFPATDDIVRTMHQRTRGWAAGLILMAKNIRKEKTTPDKWAFSPPSMVYDYFTGEFFNSMDQETKLFLMRSAYLPVMTEEAIRSLTDHHPVGDILLSLYRSHIFIERFSEPEVIYQYHPLFRDFLISKSRDTLDAEEIVQIRRKAAAGMEAVERIEDAVEIYAKISDSEALIRLIHTHAMRLIRQGRLETLRKWLALIPEGQLREDPWLVFWKGMSYPPGRADKARGYFEKAFALFEQAGTWPGIYIAWSRIIDCIILAWDDFTALDQWIDWFEDHPPTDQTIVSDEISARVAVCFSGALIVRKPIHPDLKQWIEKALHLSRKVSDPTVRLKAGIWAVTYFMWIGEFNKALIFRDKADNAMQRGIASPVTDKFLTWLDISADIRSMNSPENALDQVMRLLEEADREGSHQMDQMLFPPGVFAALVLGDFARAEILLDRFGSLPEDSHLHGLVIFHHFKGVYCMLRGRLNAASAHAETALRLALETGYVFYEALCSFQMAHIFHLTEMPEKADRYLQTACDLAVKTRSRILEFMCLLKKAHIMLAQDHDKGLTILTRALALGRHHEFVVPIWWWDPDMMIFLCGRALTAGIETDYVKRILKIHRLSPEEDQQYIEDWPWPVKIHTLGRLRILINGNPLHFKGRPPKKPLELLQVLIAYGGENVPIERIIDALWYETEGDQAHSAFSTTLNRLRKLLTFSRVVEINNGKVSLNPEYCWTDILAFNRMVEKGRALWKQGEEKEAATLYETAINLYAGDFLVEEPFQSYTIDTQQRTKRKYLALILKLGMSLEASKAFEKAMTYYKRGLAIDDVAEPLYQRLMTCQLCLGRPAEVAGTYHRCRNMLSEKLNVIPSVETEAIYRQIRN